MQTAPAATLSDMDLTKQDIRLHVRRLKQQCTPQQLIQLSNDALAHLRQLPEWHAAATILLYAALPDEVPTRSLIEEAMAEGRTVLLPVVQGDELELRICDDLDDLRPGAFNVFEPQGKAFTRFEDIDLAIIPGVAFTPDGERLGRGRGYYDRLLPMLGTALKVGLCWPFQLLDELPCEPHDAIMDLVVC